jgi:ribosomal protein S18 acetylase RimI-like enzyme
MTGDDHGWRIRTGAAAEVGSVLELWRRAGGRPSATDNEDAVGELLARDPESLLVAVAGDEVVGALIAAWDGWRGSFYRLAVDPAWRRRGLATALIRAGEERLERLGAVRLTAIVVDDEHAASELWERAGYSRQPDTGRFVRMLGGA